MGGRHADPPLIEGGGHAIGEVAGEREAGLDPSLLPSEELGDLLHAQRVLVDERGDDAGFVHGACGAAGLVGGKQEGLGERRGRILDQDGDVGAIGPLGQALEAVDHLQAAVEAGDADRHGRQVPRRVGALPPQCGEA
ncbi:hypothetical protein HY251_13880, partial [bacterium]|nr:hypothetical protein [bacterium]